MASIFIEPYNSRRVKKHPQRSAQFREQSNLLRLLDPQFQDADSPAPEGGGGEAPAATKASATTAAGGSTTHMGIDSAIVAESTKAPKDEKGSIGQIFDKIKKTLHIGKRSKLLMPDRRYNYHRRANRRRRKRWEYDADYDWENNGDEYEIPVSIMYYLFCL